LQEQGLELHRALRKAGEADGQLHPAIGDGTATQSCRSQQWALGGAQQGTGKLHFDCFGEEAEWDGDALDRRGDNVVNESAVVLRQRRWLEASSGQRGGHSRHSGGDETLGDLGEDLDGKSGCIVGGDGQHRDEGRKATGRRGAEGRRNSVRARDVRRRRNRRWRRDGRKLLGLARCRIGRLLRGQIQTRTVAVVWRVAADTDGGGHVGAHRRDVSSGGSKRPGSSGSFPGLNGSQREDMGRSGPTGAWGLHCLCGSVAMKERLA
jgi:hypothetical protein